MFGPEIHLEVIHEGPHCIPCEYMAKVVETIAPEFGERLRWEKVIITRKEGACRFEDLAKTLGRLPPVPSIFINGKLVFDITPGPDKLREHLRAILVARNPL
ncbi:MAG: hypothetical protein WBB19_05075 [Desulforhopalus sp.]